MSLVKQPVAVAGLFALLRLPAIPGCATNPRPDVNPAAREQVAPATDPAPRGEGGAALKDQKDRTSYSLGLDIGKDIKQQQLDARIDPLLQGIRDALQGRTPLLSKDELEESRKVFLAERVTARAKALGPQAEKNLAEGEAFLSENAKKPGVKTLPSGLQYRVIKEGEGETPNPEKNVMAHYVVRSLDGTELDSTIKTGQPAVFPVRGVIPAWSEALPLMKEGAKWELFVPSYLAYGDKGIGSKIGPFQTLIFEIELLGSH